MDDKPIIFTPTLFYEYAACCHWIWYDRFSDPKEKGAMPELTLKLFEQGVLHEKDYIKDLTFSQVKQVSLDQAFKETVSLMEAGAELIYQGVIQYQDGEVLYQGRPDLLKKMSGKSKFGNYYYEPIEIKSTKELHTEQKYQLVFYGLVLEQMQGVFPTHAAIINRDKETVPFLIDPEQRQKTAAQMDVILDIIKGNKPPLKLVSSCKQSPWFGKCVAEAEATNDIALLYRLDSRSHPALRQNGINTVTDAAKMDIDSLPKIPFTTKETLQRVKLQAQSLMSGKLIWLAKPKLPNPKLKIFFDIEGDPLLQTQYLFGFWIAGDPEFKYAKIGHVRKHKAEDRYFLYFIAEDPNEEEALWKQFLEWLEILPEDDYAVFHYANYENSSTKKLAEKYGGSRKFTQFHSKLFDLEDARKKSVIFPLYFYSIKDIAKSKFVNFQWRHAKANGAQSVFWYEQWLEDADCDVLNDIIDYNEDDVRATECFYLWLEKSGISPQKEEQLKAKTIILLFLVMTLGVLSFLYFPRRQAEQTKIRQMAAVLSATTVAPPLDERIKLAGCSLNGRLPDHACTPGAVFSEATPDITCVPGYTKTVRNVSLKLRKSVFAEYSVPYPPLTGSYELDHFIPLALGGNNNIANLFPQPAEPKPGFKEKDVVEIYLWQEVCAGRADLGAAQRQIASDWLKIYDSLTEDQIQQIKSKFRSWSN
jgi:uncharacterized protein